MQVEVNEPEKSEEKAAEEPEKNDVCAYPSLLLCHSFTSHT